MTHNKKRGFTRTIFSSKNSRGFTLIELLVVIAIIGLLASVVFASLTTARQRGRDANRVSTLKQIANVIAQADSGAASNFAGCVAADADVSTCSTPTGFTTFKDPSTPGTMCNNGGTATCQYAISRDGGVAGNPTTQDFQVCSYLEAGVGTLPAGLIRLSSGVGSGIVAGCP